jgi:hypothetical protein
MADGDAGGASMTIILLVEGATEIALKQHLKNFLDQRAKAEGQPRVALQTRTIMNPSLAKLKGRIRLELSQSGVTAVVGLIDVYPNFISAEKAKAFLREAADNDPRFYAHAAQYDVEAWLLPYWGSICQRLNVQRNVPGQHPEQVNQNTPPSKHLAELYRLARPARKYIKPIEMAAILQGKDLTIAADQCPELEALLNTLLKLSGLSPLA